MASAILRRLRLKAVACAIVGIAILCLFSWFAWRWYCYAKEERIIAELESQGAGVQREKSDSFLEMAAAVLRGPRGVSLLVIRPQVDMKLASRLPGLYALHFQNTFLPREPQVSISEKDVCAISEMTQLQIISMDRVTVDHSLWNVLPRLKCLKWLILEDIEVKNEGVANVAKARGLTRLYLNNCGMTDENLLYLCRLSELNELGLRQSHFSTTGLRQLKDLPKLTSLDLAKCGLTDECLNALNSCRALSCLDVSDNPITDNGLEILCHIKTLEIIRLNNTQISDAGLQAFAGRTAGLSLSVKGTTVTKAGMAKLNAVNPFMEVKNGKD